MINDIFVLLDEEWNEVMEWPKSIADLKSQTYRFPIKIDKRSTRSSSKTTPNTVGMSATRMAVILISVVAGNKMVEIIRQ